MNKKSHFLFIVFCTLFSIRCAATSSIGFGAATLSNRVVKPGDTLIINTWLINYGPDAFNAKVGFGFSINGTQNINRGIFSNPIEQQTISIKANDSFPLAIPVVIQAQYLVPGSDIFVVWPIIKNGNWVHDSLAVRFTVDEATPVDQPEQPQEPSSLKMQYINQNIAVDYTGPIEPIDLRIFDMNGKAIYNSRIEYTCHIPFYSQPSGIYFIEVIAGDKARKVYKIVKLDR